MKWLVDGVVPDQHKPQMLAQMAVTGRKWCDFVSYDPRFPAPHNIMVRRFEPTTEETVAIETAAMTFLAEVEKMWDALIGLQPEQSNVCQECGFKQGWHSPACSENKKAAA